MDQQLGVICSQVTPNGLTESYTCLRSVLFSNQVSTYSPCHKSSYLHFIPSGYIDISNYERSLWSHVAIIIKFWGGKLEKAEKGLKDQW